MRRIAAIPLLLAVLASALPAAALGPGDEAPPLSITKWVKGEAIDLAAAREKNVVVVEFWATWCPPCIVSIPHLTKLQKELAGKGVVVVGVTRPDPRNSLEMVEKFVAGKGDTMDYRVAFDGDGKTFDAYMKAAGQGGIPTAFIVDRTGKLAWIGHPMQMDGPLEEVLAGAFDPEMAAIVGKLEKKVTALLRAGKNDEAFRAMEALAALDTTGQWRSRLPYQKVLAHIRSKDLEKAAGAAAKAIEEISEPQLLISIASMLLVQDGVPGGADLAARAARKAIEKDPKGTGARVLLARVLLKAGKTDEGLAEAKKLFEAAWDDASVLNNASWELLTEGDYPAPVIKEALRAAERCHELTKGENWMYLDTLAFAKFKTGSVEKAVELERKALELAEKAKAPAANLKEFRERLEKFEKALKEKSVDV